MSDLLFDIEDAAERRCRPGRYSGPGQRPSRVPTCGRLLPVAAFAIKADCIGGRDSRCMLCARLWNGYRLSYAAATQIIERQLGRCAILGCDVAVELGSGKMATHIDHDHSCDHPGKGVRSCAACVRGILCGRCNVAVGWIEKYPELVPGWFRYLQHEGGKEGFGWALGAVAAP